uniref:Uncharacterized protein n=1 Tax=viral metagenome TaxID=1070528 RepID=A0A6C0CK98_9ZZZZ
MAPTKLFLRESPKIKEHVQYNLDMLATDIAEYFVDKKQKYHVNCKIVTRKNYVIGKGCMGMCKSRKTLKKIYAVVTYRNGKKTDRFHQMTKEYPVNKREIVRGNMFSPKSTVIYTVNIPE